MKKTKALSMLLIASVMISMTGCSGAKKQVIAAADEYAKAILAADAGDIADLTGDGDEEVLEAFFDTYSSNEDIAEIYDFILENTTYEIDKKSVEVKDKKASAVIVFTMVDYMDVYDDLDDDAEAEDYLEALEDATDSTCEVELKVSFKLSKDEWLVDDEDYEDLLEFYEFYPEISELGFGSVRAITAEMFEDTLRSISDIDADEIYTYEGSMYVQVTYHPNDIYIFFYEYESIDTADLFEDVYDTYLDMIADEDFEGDHTAYNGEDYGYILLDGESFSDDILEGEVYGGIYYCDGSFAFIMAQSHDQSDENTINQILDALGYPKP